MCLIELESCKENVRRNVRYLIELKVVGKLSIKILLTNSLQF